MTCEPWREAISARADGEPMNIEPRLVDAHLATCVSCRTFERNAHELGRGASVGTAPVLPDISGDVVKAVRAADRGSVWWVLRLALAVVATQVIVLSVPALLLGHATGSDSHGSRHLGSFSVAYAIGLLVVALRPAKARGMLPLAAALAGCLAVTAVIDVITDHTPAIAEVDHIPELVGLVLVWALAMPHRLPGVPTQTGLPRLTVVESDEGAARESS
jgi:predicted anti-sigma-YlaC factor YlaD